jgi:hypothetical protein
MSQLLDPNPGFRSEADWRQLLRALVESLSLFTGIRFKPTSWLVRDDVPVYASVCNCVDVRGVVNPAFRLDACGVVCITVNVGEAVWASCDLLVFASGQRVRGSDGEDFVCLSYSDEGWSSLG